MIVRHEWEEPLHAGDNDTDIIDRQILVDDSLGYQKWSGFFVQREPDGGIRLTRLGEDEVTGFDNKCEVILAKADLDRIKEFEQKGLI